MPPSGKKNARQDQARLVAQLEASIAALESRKAALEAEIADPATYANGTRGVEAAREYTAILEVEGPAGKSRRSDVWGVSVR